MLLFFSLISCMVPINKMIGPGKSMTFVNMLTPNDQQIIINISNLSKDSNLRYKITTPAGGSSSDSDFDSSLDSSSSSSVIKKNSDTFGDTVKGTVSKTYRSKGTYTISLFNAGKVPIEFGIASHVSKKVNETNKDIMELRNVLNSLQNAMEDLGNENYFLKSHQDNNLKEAKFIRRSMTWLLVFPILTFAVGYFKYISARQLVKPKGKRFKGLF